MKTVILAGLDNLVFSSADYLNPLKYKLIGYATTIQEAWNIYDNAGKIKDIIDEIPVMPMEVISGYEPDCMILASSNAEDEEILKYKIFCADFRGEVISLFDSFSGISLKTSAMRKMAWRLHNLGVEGAAADLGAYYGDISWQLNALMPERKLYLFDTFTGYDARDIAKEQELELSNVKAGDYHFTDRELEKLDELILDRMPAKENVVIRKGWFPETAYELENVKYAFVHIDIKLYQPVYCGIQYFFSRINPGGVIFVSGYEDGKYYGVRQAVMDLEERYGAFLITPINDLDGTIMIMHP